MANEEAAAVNDSAVQDTGVTDSAPVEETSLEVVTEGRPIDPNSVSQEEDAAEDVADDTDESEAVADTEQPQGEDKPLAPKSENRFQKLANENRELKEQLARLQSQETQVATEQELLNQINPETGDYFTPAEAERIARNQALESQQQYLAQERSTLQIQQTQTNLANEAAQVTQEVPILREFNPDGSKNPDYNPDIAAEYDSLLGDNLVYMLPDGNSYTANQLIQAGINPETQATLVGAYNSPYKLAKTVAKAYESAAVPAQIKGQKATEKMLSQADNPSSAKPSKSSKDDSKMSAEEYAEAHGLKTVW